MFIDTGAAASSLSTTPAAFSKAGDENTESTCSTADAPRRAYVFARRLLLGSLLLVAAALAADAFYHENPLTGLNRHIASPRDIQTAVAIPVPPPPARKVELGEKGRFGQLTPGALAAYRDLSRKLDEGNWAAFDKVLGQLPDRRLSGDYQGLKLADSRYNPSQAEMTGWLA